MTSTGPYKTALVTRTPANDLRQAPPRVRHRSALANQIALNEVTWGQLVELGVTPATKLEIDFTFVAPGMAEALALREKLAEHTDYTLSLGNGAGSTSTVTGTTRPTSLTLETLDAWVDAMITMGLAEDCDFAGWGTEAP